MIDINLSKINKSYGFDKVLNDIDLTVQKGDKVALIGPNGSGKSTILKIIFKLENIDSGEVSIRKGASIGYLSQIPTCKDILVKEYIYDAFSDLINIKSKLDILESSLSSDINVIEKYMKVQEQFISMGGYEYETKINKVLAVFNINDEMLNRNFSTLSGGEKTICSLIRLLLMEPDILLLDEPTNHLDIKRVMWLEKYLRSYNGSVILVSHDRYFIDKVVNKIVLLTKRGLEIYHGNYSYFIEESDKRLMLEFKKYKDREKIVDSMKRAIKKLYEFGRLCGPTGGEIFYRRAISIKKRLEKMEILEKPCEKKKINIDFNSTSRTGYEVLKVNKLNLGFGDKVLFDNVSFDLLYKEKVCLIGENGTGKTTFIKELLNGNECIKMGTNIKLGYIPQEIVFENDNLTVLEEARKFFMGEEMHLRVALNKYIFIGDDVYKRVGLLSGGEKIRLKLFCMVQNKYNFLILDEPTNHIDIDTREILENALIEFSGTILFISHDRYFINKIANNILELCDKKLNKYVGNYDDYIKYKH